MKLYLNLFYPHPEDLSLAKSLGFHGVRTGPSDDANQAEVADVVGKVLLSGLEGLFITRSADVAHSIAQEIRGVPGTALELGNEEDSKRTPRDYHRWLMECVRGTPGGVRTFTAGITTPDKRRLEWLRQVYALGVPEWVNTAVHTYRTDWPPSHAHPGFKSRFEEFAAVREIVGSRRGLVNSEIGYHSAPSKRKKSGFAGLLGFTEMVQFSEQQISNFVHEEARINKLAGCEIMVLYQVSNGPREGSYYEDSFGLRRMDGTLTPLAQRIQVIAAEVA